MILSMPAIPTIPTCITDLSATDVNALLDVRLFGRGRWCNGELVQSSSGGVYHCQICGATEEFGMAATLFGDQGHPRMIPEYTVEQIISVMKTKDQTAQNIFASVLRFAITGPQPDAVRGTSRELLLVLYGLTARAVGEAALKACGVVSPQGIVR